MSISANATGSLSGSVSSVPTVNLGAVSVVMPNIVAPLLGQSLQNVPAPVMMPSRSVPGLMEQGPPAASAAPTPVVASNVPPSAPPPSLTANLPDPAAVQRQKDGHLRALDTQLKEGLEKLDISIKQKRQAMLAQAEKQKADFAMKVDAEVKMQELDLDKQFLSVVQYVKQEATRQRAMLEQQSMQLTFQYQEKKVEEDMLAQQFELHKQQHAIQETIQRQPAVEPLKSLVPLPVPVQSQQVVGAPVSPTPSVIPAPIVEALEYREVRANSYMPPVMAAPSGYTSSSYVPQVVTSAEVSSYSSMVPRVAGPPSLVAAAPAPIVRSATPITPATVLSSPLPSSTIVEAQPARVLKTVTRATKANTLSVAESAQQQMAAPDRAAGSS